MDKLSEVLSDAQERAVKACVSGKNVFITGCAGTGKSLVLAHIIARIGARVNYYVTASTGVAASQIGGMTLHSFASTGIIEDGSVPDVPNVVKKIRFNKQALERWKSTQTLIIDEASMVAPTYFELLHDVACAIRKNGLPFGGIQLIVTGDFLQLPPVSKAKPTVQFVFQTGIWKRCFAETTFLLKDVYRQKDTAFSELLQRVRMNELTPADDALLMEISKRTTADAMSGDIIPTRIYARRHDVDSENNAMLDKLEGTVHTFLGKSSGADKKADEILAKNCLAPQTLHLKVGAQVILLQNISPPSLVNGSRGYVVRFNYSPSGSGNMYPVVSFDNGVTRLIEENTWVTNVGDIPIARYTQLPLCLGWAITVHKCQGMTLSKALFDAGNCWEGGQAYTGLSRFSSIDGMFLTNYKRAVIKANATALSYYRTLEAEPQEPAQKKQK